MAGPQCKVWDFTAHLTDPRITKDKILQLCNKTAKWCFQLEKGNKTGALHFQGRFTLHTKDRKTGVIRFFENLPIDFSPTSTANHKNAYYVMKEDTRVEGGGPWSDKDPKPLDPEEIPLQFREKMEPRPFQTEIRKSFGTFNKRLINYIYDPIGGSGKSTESAESEFKYPGSCISLTYTNNVTDLRREAYCKLSKLGDKKYLANTIITIFVDMARATNLSRSDNFFVAIEEIKNGKACDDRYQHHQCWIASPVIWLLANTLPPKKYLANNRYKIYTISKPDYELIPYIPDDQDFAVEDASKY